MQKKERTFKNMSREEQICETCKENDNGFCDRIGRMVEDDDWCAKWKTKEAPEWKARMMNKGHTYAIAGPPLDVNDARELLEIQCEEVFENVKYQF